MARRFLKMHGLGNDFIVLDARKDALALTPEVTRALADRRTGIGCDQLIVIEPARNGGAAFMRILNADGSEVEQCGNAVRCVGDLLAREGGRAEIGVETPAGLIRVRPGADGLVAVNMGPAYLDWRQIPLARETDTLHVPLFGGPLEDAVAVSMGNPHAVFIVPDADAIDLATLGPALEHDPLFPQRTNVEVVSVKAPDRIRMRVWERGVGITRACGTGACASLVATARRNLTGRKAAVELDGGTLTIEWQEDGTVLMTGPVATSFVGTLSGHLAAAVAS
jgi:diaminopimelate epimerase